MRYCIEFEYFKHRSLTLTCPISTPAFEKSANSQKELRMAAPVFQTPQKEQTTAPRGVKLTEMEKRQLLENLDIEGTSTETKSSVRYNANVPRALLQWRTRNDASKLIFKICSRALQLDTRLKLLAFPGRSER